MFDKEKFKALIHYACHRVPDPRNLGAIKLNKILWFVDGITFMRTGEALTGARYVKQPMGPVPKAMLPVLSEMQREGVIRIDNVSYYGRNKKQYSVLRAPETGVFSKEQLDLIDEVVDTISQHHTGSSISEATHGNAWKLAETGEDIPFFAAMVEDLDLVTEEDIRWAIDRMPSTESVAAA